MIRGAQHFMDDLRLSSRTAHLTESRSWLVAARNDIALNRALRAIEMLRRLAQASRPWAAPAAVIPGLSATARRWTAGVGIDQHRCVQLRAEMRLPGDALLDFRIKPRNSGKCILRQTTLFPAVWLATLLVRRASFNQLVFRACLPAFNAMPFRSLCNQYR